MAVYSRFATPNTTGPSHVLHDRTNPGSRANIDHLAVTPSGVFTIETKRYAGRVEVRSWSSQPWINHRNRSNLLDQARRQTQAVNDALMRAGALRDPCDTRTLFRRHGSAALHAEASWRGDDLHTEHVAETPGSAAFARTVT